MTVLNRTKSFDLITKNSIKMISHVKSVTWRIRKLAGNMIGGLIYSQFQNLKAALYNQTKLRILIMHEKREVLGLRFLVGVSINYVKIIFFKNLDYIKRFSSSGIGNK
jgi:hypothetical protein